MCRSPSSFYLRCSSRKTRCAVFRLRRTSEGDANDNERYRRGAYNHSSEFAGDTPSRFARPQPWQEWTRKMQPEKISVARLPITGSDVFGREEDIAFLDAAWANQQVNVVTIVAWAGVGKSTLVNHWLRRMAAEHYRSAELVFGWSFYRQGSSGGNFVRR